MYFSLLLVSLCTSVNLLCHVTISYIFIYILIFLYFMISIYLIMYTSLCKHISVTRRGCFIYVRCVWIPTHSGFGSIYNTVSSGAVIKQCCTDCGILSQAYYIAVLNEWASSYDKLLVEYIYNQGLYNNILVFYTALTCAPCFPNGISFPLSDDIMVSFFS